MLKNVDFNTRRDLFSSFWSPFLITYKIDNADGVLVVA